MKTKLILLLIFNLSLFSIYSFAQNNVGIGTTAPNAKAILELNTNDKGFLAPRMNTVQMNAIAPSATENALLIYNTDSACYHFYNGLAWKNLCQKGIDTAVINKAIKNYLGGVSFTTVINNMLVDSSVTNYAVINNAIVNNITIDSSVINYTTINNATINNLTVDSSSINFTTINNAVVNNITIDSSVINYTTINNATINNLTVDSSYTNVSNSNISNINIANIDTSITNVATISVANISVLKVDSSVTNYSNINNAVIDSSVTNYSQVSHLQGGWGSMDSLQIGGQNIMQTMTDSIKSQAWLLKGNTGTNTAVNFLGTRDAQDLVIKTNNTENIKIENATGNTQVGLPATGTLDHRLRVSKDLGSNATDYTLIGQHYLQLGLSKTSDKKELELGVTDDGVGIIQSHERGVGYNSLALNPVSGNVGIGTTNPTKTLDVNGDVQLNGNLFFGNGNVRTQTRLDAGLATSAGAQSGFYDNDGASVLNYPPSAPTWWHLIESRHANPLNNMALQIAGGHYDQDLWFRKINNNPAQPWSKILAVSGTNSSLGWLTNGNSGTNSATNFIGTTDAQALIIKTNNIKRITVDSNITQVLRNLTVRDTVKYGGHTFNSISYAYHPLASSPDFVRHNQFLSSKRVPSGTTDAGYSIGMWIQNYRGLNDALATLAMNDDDGGTLTSLVGVSLQYGHHSYTQTFPSMASAVTTEAVGLSVDGAAVYGTITNAYDIRTGTSVASTNHYALYADGFSKKSYFAGNVGIGINNPGAPLHLHSANPNFHALRFTNENTTDHWDLVKRGQTYGAGANNNFTFAFNGAELVNIAPNGYVGILATTPIAPLHINDIYVRPGSDGGPYDPLHASNSIFNRTLPGYNGSASEHISFAMNNQPLARMGIVANMTAGNLDAPNSIFYINTDPSVNNAWVNPKFVIQGTTGNVGIGLSGAPVAPLHVATPATGNRVMTLQAGGLAFHYNILTTYGSFTNPDGILYVDFGGNENYMMGGTLIGDGGSGFRDLGLAVQRWNTLYCANAPDISSDMRLKTNIAPVKFGLNEVTKMNPVSYNWNKENAHRGEKLHLGFLAQELKELVPTVVHEDEKGILSVTYTELIPVLVNAIKEQQQQIDALKIKPNGDNEKIKLLEDQVQQLKQQNETILKLLQERK